MKNQKEEYVTGVVLGILSILFSETALIGLVLGTLGTILSKKKEHLFNTKAGLVLSVIGLVLSFLALILLIGVMDVIIDLFKPV